MNLQSLLASLESRFDEKFGCRCDISEGQKPNHTATSRCRGALDLDSLHAFLKQSHEEIIQAVVAWANMAKPWEKVDMELQLTTKGKFTAKSNRDSIVWQNGYRRALSDLKEALTSPKDT